MDNLPLTPKGDRVTRTESRKYIRKYNNYNYYNYYNYHAYSIVFLNSECVQLQPLHSTYHSMETDMTPLAHPMKVNDGDML